MDTNHNIDTAKAYLEGMLWAAYGVKIISCSAAEWQIDQVKECAKKLKEAEIDYSALTPSEKENLKHQWKQWIDATTQVTGGQILVALKRFAYRKTQMQ